MNGKFFLLIILCFFVSISYRLIAEPVYTDPKQSITPLPSATPDRLSLKEVAAGNIKLLLGVGLTYIGLGVILYAPFNLIRYERIYDFLRDYYVDHPRFYIIPTAAIAALGFLAMYVGAKITRATLEEIDERLSEIRNAKKINQYQLAIS